MRGTDEALHQRPSEKSVRMFFSSFSGVNFSGQGWASDVCPLTFPGKRLGRVCRDRCRNASFIETPGRFWGDSNFKWETCSVLRERCAGLALSICILLARTCRARKSSFFPRGNHRSRRLSTVEQQANSFRDAGKTTRMDEEDPVCPVCRSSGRLAD